MDHPQQARENFLRGYNCAQSVFCAFCDETGLEEEAAARLASSFGGGLGRLRELCGALSGAELVLGCLRGYSDPEDYDAKAAHYQNVRTLAERFREKNGAILCRELLKDVKTRPGGAPERRTPEYYAARPCLRLIGEAAALLDDLLRETAPESEATGNRPACRDKHCLSAVPRTETVES